MKWLWRQPKAILAIRLLLVVVFVVYGTVKLAGGQFYYGDWTISNADAPGPWLVWAFYGYSPFYGRAVGLFELIPAIMLLFPRTSLVGAGACFAVALNITLLDFAYSFPPVKYLAALYTALSLVLVLYERDKLSALFSDPGDPARKSADASDTVGG